MSDTNITEKQRPFKDLIADPKVQERFDKMLGENSTAFLMSVLNCVQNNKQLAECEPQSVLMASAVAGTLNLPVDPSLGQAYIIPYNVNTKTPQGWVKVKKAQFQIGYKGLIQLGHRSKQFRGLNVSDVREGEFKSVNRLTGEFEFEWNQNQDERKNLPLVGYVAYFELVNGFSKAMYMTTKELHHHGRTYSKTYNNDKGRWKIDFEGMASKTVLKLLIDKFAPKTVEMQKAITTDQAIIENFEGNKLNYVDNNKIIDLEELAKERHASLKKFFDDNEFDLSEEDRMNVVRVIDDEEMLSYEKVYKLLKSKIKGNG